jgi:hypothetical protein
MNPTNHDLRTLVTDEERKFKARVVLAGSRPVVLSALARLIAVLGVVFVVGDPGLPISTRIVLCLALLVPSLMLEVWYLSRRLEASLVLLGLARERPP